MLKVAILQSNYIPWKGYFDIINSVDLFIFHDDLQYTHGDWRNRNKIKTRNGLKWLTIPCGNSEKRLIHEVKIIDASWQRSHWNLIFENYKDATYFRYYKSFFEDIYLKHRWDNLSELNQFIIEKIYVDLLGLTNATFEDSRKYKLVEKKADRVAELLVKCKADLYLSGPAAKAYLPPDFMNGKAVIKWMDYSNYPEYRQLYPPFKHEVSIIDLLFNEGPESSKYLKSQLPLSTF